MPLKFPGKWRFTAPVPENPAHATVPASAVVEFESLIRRTVGLGDRQAGLEHFKRYFCSAAGTAYYRSSSAGWAQSDLESAMTEAAINPPMFIEAFHDACKTFTTYDQDEISAPDADMINEVCRRNDVPYEIEGTTLVYGGTERPIVRVVERPHSLEDDAREQISRSLSRGEALLMGGHGREAVQETLWLLESVITAFRGMKVAHDESIGGKYFNKIVREMSEAYSGTTLDRVLEWTMSLHGYLSSPTGGGVRHGRDLRDAIEPSLSAARLFVNLIRSYVSFLLSEHERLVGPSENEA